ncbi:MAG: hypothetical protein DRP16_00605 [Candidatus Aenigmatarchaeota archaeon]|nr:MAG: hypothetical protein DRP16_00605 [Candidatus Aenigmarchaeota archaeon]
MVLKERSIIIKIKVKACSKEEKIEKKGEEILMWVKAKPENNKANQEVVRILEKVFGKKVRILKGLKSRKKLVLIENIGEEEIGKILEKL